MPERKTRKVSMRDASAFIAKAERFLRAMEKAMGAGDWDAAGLNAVHSVISAADAVTAFRAGFQSAEQDHKLLAKKNTIEYEQRRLTPEEAADVAEHAGRFVSWAHERLPEL